MMFKRIAVLAALAAGTVLLTACNATESVSGAGQGNPAGTAADVRLAASDDEPVDCGEVEVDGTTHMLTAERTAGGIVGCTEAFNVLDEYLTHGTSTEDTNLSNGWSCTTDDGETASVGCVKGLNGEDYDFAFHTEPQAGEPVDCGEVEVDGTTHTLTAEPTAEGIVGCTEAFNVLDEYLTHGTSTEDTMLSNGWSCVTDDGETATIGCLNDFGLAFTTTPV
jgi:predicted small secreted protein